MEAKIKNSSFKNAKLKDVNCELCTLENVSLESQTPLNKNPNAPQINFWIPKKKITLLEGFKWGTPFSNDYFSLKYFSPKLKDLCKLPKTVTFSYIIYKDKENNETKNSSDREEICTSWNINNPYKK